MDKNTNIRFLDYLNIFSCISVIALHVNHFWGKWDPSTRWYVNVLIETMFYTAVPCFFMISGATLIDYRKKYGTSQFFKKRFAKAFIPFFVWSAIILLDIFLRKNILQVLSFPQFVEYFLSTKYHPTYWFFMPLFGCYLTIPILGCFKEEYKKKIFEYCIVCSLITNYLLPFICKVANVKWNGGLAFQAFSGQMIYVLLGYYLIKYCNFNFKQRLTIYFLGFVGWFLRFIYLIILSGNVHKIVDIFRGAFTSVFFATAVFVFFQYEVSRWNILNRIPLGIIKNISGCSFGIYLIHIFVLKALEKCKFMDVNSLSWKIIGVVLVYVISFILVSMLKKIPVLNRIVP